MAITKQVNMSQWLVIPTNSYLIGTNDQAVFDHVCNHVSNVNSHQWFLQMVTNGHDQWSLAVVINNASL